MQQSDIEIVINAIDTGLREFADFEVYLIPYLGNTNSSLFDEQQDLYGEPIQIYALIDYRQNEYDYELKREIEDRLLFQFSLKALRERNLVDEYDLPIFNDKWRIKHKNRLYNIKKIDWDNPFGNVYLTFRVYCSPLFK